MKNLLASLVVAFALWCAGVALVLAQQPFFFPIPLGLQQAGNIIASTAPGAINIGCTGNVTSCQTTAAYVSAFSNEFLILFASCGTSGSSVTGASDNGPGLVWTQRASVSNATSAGYASVWWAQAVGSFSGKVTATYSGCNPGNAIVAVFGVANVAAPPHSWDINASLPAITTGSGTNPVTGPISTTLPASMLLSFEHGLVTGCCGGPSIPAGWTAFPSILALANLGGCCLDLASIAYKLVSTTQTATSATYGATASSWGTIGDALDSQ